MTPALSFFVPGIPKTSGSKRAFMRPGMRFPIITEDCKGSKDWRGDVKRFALQAYSGEPMEGPLELTLSFTMPRPKGHLRSNGQVKPGAPLWHEKKPDVLKMARAVEDALTGILWRDDSQIAYERLTKSYGNHIGCDIIVKRLDYFPAGTGKAAIRQHPIYEGQV